MKLNCKVDSIIYQSAYLRPQPADETTDTIAVEFRGVPGAALVKQLKAGSLVTLTIEDAPASPAPPPAPPK